MSVPKIKFCGFTREEDLVEAIALGVDYVGFVFAARSKRRVTPDQAHALRAIVPAGIGVVALVMDNPRQDIEQIVETLQPDVLQFHGAEDDAFCAGFGLPFFKAIAMGDGGDPLPAMATFPSAYGYVLDGHGAGEQGGSGRSFDWHRLPQATSKPILLAGGLRAANVAAAIRTARPWGVDVSSGIESAPGIKDAGQMRSFIAEVRAQ